MTRILFTLIIPVIGAVAMAGFHPAQASDNTILGTGAGASLTADAHDNTLLGGEAGAAITISVSNTIVGNQAGELTTGNYNTLVGDQAGRITTTGSDNAFFGQGAGLLTTTGGNNTYLGRDAGHGDYPTGVHNVFVGNGADENGSNTLFIHPQTSYFALIGGRFDLEGVIINGALGVGTQIPLDQLHVRDGNLRIEQTGATHATLNFVSNGKTWEIKNNQATGRLTFFSPGGGASTASFKFDRQAVENLLRVGVLNALTVDINGNLVVTGDITNPDDVFTPQYPLETIEGHAASMWRHRHLPAVGPGQVNAQGQAVVNVAQCSQGMLEELEKAHIYIAQLKDESIRQDEQLAALTGEVTELQANETKLAALKSQMMEKEVRLDTLQGEVTALKALVQQLMVQDRAAAPGEEG